MFDTRSGLRTVKTSGFVGLMLCVSTICLFGQQSNRALPDDNLGYPVLISFEGGVYGSGFYLDTGSALYLVTAKHVLFDPATGSLRGNQFKVLSYSKDPSDRRANIVRVNVSELGNDNVKSHPSKDVVVVKMFVTNSGGAFPLSGVTVEQSAKLGLLSVAMESITKFDQVLVGNDSLIMGLPNSIGLQQMPQIDTQRPLLRRGLIAGTNMQNKSIVLDCPSYPGNSGGPVIEVDQVGFSRHFSVIGVISQFVPYVENAIAAQGAPLPVLANSGYSIATPMDFVLELAK